MRVAEPEFLKPERAKFEIGDRVRHVSGSRAASSKTVHFFNRSGTILAIHHDGGIIEVKWDDYNEARQHFVEYIRHLSVIEKMAEIE